MVAKSISAVIAIINLHPIDRGRRGQIVGGKASFLHHDYEHYSNYRCTDKKCNHSFFVWKSAAITAPSMSNLFGKHDFKRIRYSALNSLTTAQVAGLNLSKQRKREFLLVA